MIPIRMITFHTPKNYGAVLQAYGLLTCLRKYSDDVRVIDYNTPHLRGIYPVLPKPNSVKSLVKYCLMLPHFSAIASKYRKFEDFKNNHLHLTKRFESTEELYSEKWSSDIVFFTGSDQVFNPNRIKEERKAFYLDFVSDGCKRIAYAASLGVAEIPNEKKEEIISYLTKFQHISIREASGAQLISKLINCTVPVVLDPVFLCDKQTWESIIAPYHKEYKNYVLYYKVLSNHDSEFYARKIADEKHLKLIAVTQDMLKVKSDAVLYDVGPEELLGLIKNASFVVTDAFHGAALSIIMQKQFVFADRGRTNNRGLELLRSVGILENSYCEYYNEKTYVDYNAVEAELEKMVCKSKQYIENALGL